MENDDTNWTKLGDVVRGITDRLEVTTARPPVPVDDAVIFVRLLREVYGPRPRHTEGPAEDGATK